MKILIYTPAFYPNIGGLENVTMLLCKEFVKAGHSVKTITKYKNNVEDNFSFEVIRDTSFFSVLKELRWADIFYQPNVSLKGLLPWLLVRKPIVFSHNGWYTRRNGKLGLRDRLKFLFMRFGANISVSRAVAEHINVHSTLIPNPYDVTVFKEHPELKKTKNIIFVGRLVSDKGIDVLINALSLLNEQGLEIHLDIIGDGPEKHSLTLLAEKLKLNKLVNFLGSLRDNDLALEISKHKIMVIPSKWNEPFGIVALEGIACGCVVIGSEGGGLKDAIGKCGLTFKNGAYIELAEKIELLLSDENYLNSFKVHFAEHLQNHKPEKVAQKYLQVFESALR